MADFGKRLKNLGLGALLVLCAWGLVHAQQGAAKTAEPAPAATEAPASEWDEAYQKRVAALEEQDAEGHYRLGFWLFEQYNPKKKNRRALELAQNAFNYVAEIDPSHPHLEKMQSVVKAELKALDARLNPDYLAIVFSVLGGLGIFLLGMKHMSEGMQAIAGDRLRRLIGVATDNRVAAVGTGAAVTCLVQSSSITTVIVVGFVNSGIMLLHQAIGVVMGANIGTTITGWILVLKIGKYGLPILGAAAFVYLFSRSDRWHYLAMAVMGLGMVFFGLEMMKDGFKPIRDVPAFVDAFMWFSADSYFGVLKCALVGCILTFIVQSSSATLGITIGLASTGVIPFQTAAALVLGENIGTTITAWLASIGATQAAKRAAYAHVLFNVIGVAWITAVFLVYVKGVAAFIAATKGHSPLGLDIDTFGDEAAFATIVTAGIAATHTGFNVINTLIFLPFVRVYARFLEWLMPDRAMKETPHLTSLDVRMIESPIIGIERAHAEVVKMAEGIQKMLGWTREILNQSQPDEQLVDKVFHREKVMDNVQQEVIQFMTDLLTGEVPHSVAEEGRELLRIADEYESVSDYISTVLKSHLRLVQAEMALGEDDRQNLMELHDATDGYLQLIHEAIVQRESDVLSRAETRSAALTHRFKEMRDEHLLRLTEQRIDPVYSMCYNAMLRAYRKIKDHALNIAEALAGQK